MSSSSRVHIKLRLPGASGHKIHLDLPKHQVVAYATAARLKGQTLSGYLRENINPEYLRWLRETHEVDQ